MKKYLLLHTFVALLAGVGCNSNRTVQENDTTIQDQQADTSTEEIQEKLHNDHVVINEPYMHATITSPLVIKGSARGSYFFEATFPVYIVQQKDTIGVGYAQADGAWMTTAFVPFTATIKFNAKDKGTGEIILQKANASGLQEHDLSFRMPVRF